ncbi:MAG: L-fuculose-phosphate aldolase [Alphaproteobacteria bacterium]
MDDAEFALRKEIVATCRAMNDAGINQGMSGNVSVRWGEGLLISPSSIEYSVMSASDIVYMAMDGTYEGALPPSTEWRFHRAILAKRPEFNAIVHAHPTYCTALAISHREIPAVHYMVAASGGPNVRCAPYATYGTQALSDNALAALESRKCCLLAHHGMIACEVNLGKALWLAIELETLARQYVVALQLGEPPVLPDAEIAIVVEKFRSYGQQSDAE